MIHPVDVNLPASVVTLSLSSLVVPYVIVLLCMIFCNYPLDLTLPSV